MKRFMERNGAYYRDTQCINFHVFTQSLAYS